MLGGIRPVTIVTGLSVSDILSPAGRAFIISLQKLMPAVILTRGTQRKGRPFHRHCNRSFRNLMEFLISPQCSLCATRLSRTGIILSLMHANLILAISPRVVWRSMAVLTCFKIVALARSCTGTTVRKWILRDYWYAIFLIWELLRCIMYTPTILPKQSGGQRIWEQA